MQRRQRVNGMIDATSLNPLLACLRQLPDLKTQEIANALYGIGQLAAAGRVNGMIDATSLNLLLVHLPQLPGLKTQGIANALYGIGQLAATEKISGQLDQHLITQLITSQHCTSLDGTNISQIAQAIAYINLTIPQTILTQLAKLKPTSTSHYQKTAIDILNRNLAGIQLISEHLIDAWFVDIYFEYQGKKYIIELDGPHHYVNGELRKEDTLRDAYFKKKNYDVIRIKNEDLSEQRLLNYLCAPTKHTTVKTSSYSGTNTLFSSSAPPKTTLRADTPVFVPGQKINAPH